VGIIQVSLTRFDRTWGAEWYARAGKGTGKTPSFTIILVLLLFLRGRSAKSLDNQTDPA
jgi:hypothetical protein